MVAQPGPDFPVPVGEGAVSPSVPEAQAKPGQRGDRHGQKVPATGSPPHPAKAVEHNPRCVEHEEEDVESAVGHADGPDRSPYQRLRVNGTNRTGIVRRSMMPWSVFSTTTIHCVVEPTGATNTPPTAS